MSLKSMIFGSTSLDREFQAIIREVLPTKEQFNVYFSDKAFSKYEPLVPYNLNSSSEASLVGTAFDYLARVMIAQTILNGKESAVMGLKALAGITRIERRLDKPSVDALKNNYAYVLELFIDYIYSTGTLVNFPIEKSQKPEFDAFSKYLDRRNCSSFKPLTSIEPLIPASIYFAKLEQIFRNGGLLPEDGISSLFSAPDPNIIHELRCMCELFQKRFITEQFVKPNSFVVFNPSFGTVSLACGGADADVYIDGTLYDFKSGKKTGYDWKEVAQLVSYYYFRTIASYGKSTRAPNQLKEHPIKNIAFYRARYGVIEWHLTNDLSNEVYSKLLEHLTKRIDILFPE